MIRIDALPAFNDNYLWLLQDDATRRCAVVDPGDAAPVLAWLQSNPSWQLSDILITHHHSDHVGGVAALKQATGAHVHGPAHDQVQPRDTTVGDGDHVAVLGLDFQVIAVPGHTLTHIAYFHASAQQPLLFSGDTLFAAGCGRLFEGTAAQMRHSLGRLASLPDDTLVYCAHEYTLSNLQFARAVEPENPRVAQRFAEVAALRNENRISLPSSIAQEKATNPFLRCAEPAVQSRIDEREHLQNPSLDDIFAAVRGWKDVFKAS
jgi:hydroxyacylglutathione hydrolase